MWLQYGKERISLSGAYRISLEEDTKIILHYWNGHTTFLEFDNLEARDKNYNILEKEVLRAVTVLK